MTLERASIRKVAIVAAVALAVVLSWLPAVQRAADQQVDAGLKRALLAFAVAKTLNAAISTVQGTSLHVQPFGIGVTTTVGEILDPLNDMVEQFASLMLMASVAFGIQKILLAISAHGLVSFVLTALAGGWAVVYLRGAVPPWLSRALLVMLLVRFAMPVALIGSDWVFREFLQARYAAAQQALGKASVTPEAQAVKEAAATSGPSTGKGSEPTPESRGGWPWSKSSDTKDADPTSSSGALAKIKDMKASVERATEHIIDLIVIFVMQTLIVPIALLWVMIRVATVPSLGTLAKSRIPPIGAV
jgi:hypothetical protein